MSEIRFRGKRTDNGEPVEGFYISHAGVVHYIIPAPFGGYEDSRGGFYVGEFYQVEPGTIGLVAPEPRENTVELPYPVGSHVFAIRKGKIKEFEYTNYEIWRDGKGEIRIELLVQTSATAKEFISAHIGKTWFLTREEAEKALADRPPGGEE